MAVIVWPQGLVPGPGSGWGQQRHDLLSTSDATGAQQARLLGPPRWRLSLVQPEALQPAEAGQWQAVVMQLRGRVNHLLCWDFGRQVPLGTLRGNNLRLGATAAAGETTLQLISGVAQASRTLLPGDKLQVGTGLGTSQVVMVMAPAQANGSGAITVTVEPPLRRQYNAETAVAWDRASAYFKAQASATGWQYAPAVGGPVVSGLALDLVEVWS
jgi:hypothetical protein